MDAHVTVQGGQLVGVQSLLPTYEAQRLSSWQMVLPAEISHWLQIKNLMVCFFFLIAILYEVYSRHSGARLKS